MCYAWGKMTEQQPVLRIRPPDSPRDLSGPLQLGREQREQMEAFRDGRTRGDAEPDDLPTAPQPVDGKST